MQTRYDTPIRHKRYKSRPKEKGSLTSIRLLACLMLVGLTLFMRLFLPGATSIVQNTVLPQMQRNIDYRLAIETLGESITGEAGFTGVFEGLHMLAFGTYFEESVYVAAYPKEVFPDFIEENEATQELPPIEEVFPVPDFSQEIYQLQNGSGQERETPEAVAVFFAHQAAFETHAVPERVSLSYATLPIAFQSPVTGPISSPFGFRNHPIQREVRFHFGTDIGVYTGTPFYAFADGTVIYANQDDGWGKYILLYHGNGIYTRYAHANALYVAEGQEVEKGQIIGRVGQTGAATGPHLHFELVVDGLFRNPEFYIQFS